MANTNIANVSGTIPAPVLTVAEKQLQLERHSAIVNFAKSRRLEVRPLPNGKWRVFDSKGSQITNEEYTEYEDAIEAAEIALSQADARQLELSASRYVTALRAARYIPWPQTRQGDGQIEWVILTVPNRQTVGTAHSGLDSALAYIATLVGV